MATPPKKKLVVRPSKLAQKHQEQQDLKKMINWVVFLLIVPVIVLAVKQLNPGIFYIAQAKSMQRFGKYDSAQKAWIAAYDANPEKNAECLVEAAWIADYQDDREGLRDLVNQILDEGTKAGPQEKAAGNIWKAWLAYYDGRYDEVHTAAEPALAQANALYKYKGWMVIGAAYTKQRVFDKAYDALESSLDQRRMFASEAHLYMGLMYEAWGKFNEATEEYDYGMDQQPDPKTKALLNDAKARALSATP